jgi:gag-polyprotein putative aspartyl protease
MYLKLKLLLASFLCYTISHAQQAVIDTIPFTLDKKLLVFKAQINNVPIDFAFDTGATIGVANSDNLEKANFKVKKSGKRITDSNDDKKRLKNVVLEDIAIGSQHFSNTKSVMADMEALQCNGLYLLGIDIISQLNWKFNFDKKEIYISTTPFAVDETYTELPVKNMNKRPKINIAINNKTYSNCLIDFGYTGIIDIPEDEAINEQYNNKQATTAANIALTSTMGIGGWGKPDTLKTMLTDSVNFAGKTLYHVPIAAKENTELKIGVGFLAGSCSEVIINSSTKNYYLQFAKKTAYNLSVGFDARVTIVNNKFEVSAKSLQPNNTASSLSIGEEIKTVNGKSVAEYGSSCNYFNTIFVNKEKEMVVEKLNGEKVVIKKQALQ